VHGDGQHGWAAAEWVMMIRNMFVREEGSRLIIGSSILPGWLESDGPIEYGPAWTPYGPLRISPQRFESERRLHLDCDRRQGPVPVAIQIPGHNPERLTAAAGPLTLKLKVLH
jgi:hypothetical protein